MRHNLDYLYPPNQGGAVLNWFSILIRNDVHELYKYKKTEVWEEKIALSQDLLQEIQYYRIL